MEKQRDYLWDNIKAVLIFLVVLGHIFEMSALKLPLGYAVDYWIYSFHMPAFIFVSGFWAKSYCRNGRVRVDKLAVLINYYIVFQILFSIIKAVSGVSMDNASFLAPTRGLWYLLALIAYYLVVPLAERVRPWLMLPAVVILSLLVGRDVQATNYLAIMRIFVFAPFFFAGYYTTEKAVAKLRSVKPAIRYPLGYGILILSSVSVLFLRHFVSIKLFFGKTSYKNAGLDPIAGMLFRLLTFALAGLLIVSLLMIMTSKRTFFSYIGANSLQIFIYHMALIIALSDSGLLKPVIDSYLGFALAVAAAVAVTAVLSPTPLGAPFRLIAKGTKKLVKTE